MYMSASDSTGLYAGRAAAYAFLCSLPLLSVPGAARAEPLTLGTAAVNTAKAAVVHNVIKNFEGANRETSTVDKMLKSTTGVSAKDIRAHGIWGGPNSVFRKPFG